MKVLLEIRAGVGGDDAAKFVNDLGRMYLRYAIRRKWKAEIITDSPLTIRLDGAGVDAILGEAGNHCIQRVPANERRGRIHTSNVTVAAYQEVPPTMIAIASDSLVITTKKSSGKGGQNANKTETSVQIKHLPTGITANCEDERSQKQNMDNAMAIIRARVWKFYDDQVQKSATDSRNAQIGQGFRAERMRTYDLPEDLVADRKLGLKIKGAKRVLDGDLDALFSR